MSRLGFLGSTREVNAAKRSLPEWISVQEHNRLNEDIASMVCIAPTARLQEAFEVQRTYQLQTFPNTVASGYYESRLAFKGAI